MVIIFFKFGQPVRTSNYMPENIKILLIEDDRDDIEFLKVALDDNNIKYSMETIIRGDLVPEWLKKCKDLPDIVIMDLNLPKIHGREVLCIIKDHPKFKTIPLIVLTTSSLPEDIDYCLQKGADKFISKPATTEGFAKLVGEIVKIASGSKTRH
jgi:CheY-like chemotaxis protein